MGKNLEEKRSYWALGIVLLLIVGLFACGRQGYQPQVTSCDGVDCSGHGECVEADGKAVCICDAGYRAEGPECVWESTDNPCLGVTCSGYGTCAVRDEEAWCVCAEGFHNDGQTNCVADVRPCEGADGTECDDGQFCTVNDRCMGGVCAGVANDCDDGNSCSVDTCNEVDDICINTLAPDGVPCDDGAYCSLGEICSGGTCTGGLARNCSDGNPCTADSCDDEADSCLNEAVSDGTACDDGAYCTAGETCTAGVCAGGAPIDCTDGNVCTSDVCDESIDSCVNPPLVDGTPCDDGAFCTVGDVCAGGSCVGATARDCSDGDQCSSDACDDNLDECVHNAVPDGTICNDGQFCTIAETCTGGVCTGGQARDCSDGNPCTIDNCNDSGDTCDHANEANGTLCDDGLYCTLGDSCTNGVCAGTARNCDDGDVCTLDSCDEDGDACVGDSAAMNGAGCDDGQYCTVGDTCSGGTCTGSPNQCDDGNACTADSCDEGSNQCLNTAVADGAGCDDGQYCTVGDVCTGGTCSGSPRDCSDASVCTADSCNEVANACSNLPVASGTACDDGQYCTVAETCNGGVCGGGAARNCSDGNQCTADTCDDNNDQCVNQNEPAGTPCDDSSYCTVGETCSNGACSGGSTRNCADTNDCTLDVCNEGTDACDHPAVLDGTPCDDGQFCTLADNCAGGVCGGAPNSCDDGNACTADVCDDVNDTCVGTPVVNGTPCDDGQFCTLGETCTTGACGGGVARNCSDGSACTADTCNDATDQCVNTAVSDGTACNDGAYCTQGETCTAGVCGGASMRDCTDSDVCTQDVCDEAVDACLHLASGANGTPCDDGQYCTMGDVCSGGVCTGSGVRDCSDGNICTLDSCNDGTNQCDHDAAAANGNACDDGLFCTINDSCSSGSCLGGPARNCSDGNVCTADSCDEGNDVCVNDAAAADGNACDDGSYCTQATTCSGGFCTGGNPRNCADALPCTADSCNDVTDQCDHLPVTDGTGCDDGQFCTVAESCTGGVCGGGSPRNCSDGNQCTADSCNEGTSSCDHDMAAMNGSGCDDGQYCVNGETCNAGVCGGGGPRDCTDGNLCTADTCNEGTSACDHDAAAMDSAPCDDGNFCLVGESCNSGVCGGGSVRPCDDGNSCTQNNCNVDHCENPNVTNGTGCQDGLFCTAGDSCLTGVCQPGGGDPCTGNPCANNCDEALDICGGCAPAGKVCYSPVQEATCDGACNMTELLTCVYGCNAVRQECNQCAPSTTECKGDAEYLCNAEFVCDANGLLQSKTCCTTNRCACDSSMCLEDLCAAAPDMSAGGNLSGTTCDDHDHIPGDCYPGGAACKSVAAGGAPEEMFQFTLDDGTGDSKFYTVTLDSGTSALDTTLRVSTICGSETAQVPTADVCGAPGVEPDWGCSEQSGPETMAMCGLPEGTYFGAVDSPAYDCGNYSMDVSMSQVNLDTGPQAGNISMGGTFSGNTCALTDDFSYPDNILWGAGACGDCVNLGGGNYDCPACGVAAATDCTLAPNSNEDRCTYSGAGSKDAVFYLALEYQTGIDISTDGSDFDTVLYIMETGPSGTSPPGPRKICNDDCRVVDGPSHIQTSLAPGLYYVYLDGAGGACGNYVLSAIVSPAAHCENHVCEVPYESCAKCPIDCNCPNCGDGTVDPAEECDDNNTGNGDGCSDKCGIEAGYNCVGEPSQCGILVYETSNCDCAIDDCSAGGPVGSACNTSDYGTRIDTITVPGSCTILDLNVDMNINHTWRGDLSIELQSPGGTSVTLKAQDIGDSGADVVGNFDKSLPVDGPGALSDFNGGPGNGTWTLTIHDWWKGDTGTLNSWGLHLTCQ